MSTQSPEDHRKKPYDALASPMISSKFAKILPSVITIGGLSPKTRRLLNIGRVRLSKGKKNLKVLRRKPSLKPIEVIKDESRTPTKRVNTEKKREQLQAEDNFEFGRDETTYEPNKEVVPGEAIKHITMEEKISKLIKRPDNFVGNDMIKLDLDKINSQEETTARNQLASTKRQFSLLKLIERKREFKIVN